VLTLALAGFGSGQPETGATVKMCSGTDSECAPPIDEQMTDSNGIVRLTENASVLNGGQRGLNGFLEVTAPDLFPTTIYWGFPLSEPHGVFSTPLPVFSLTDAADLAFSGINLDASRGHVAVLSVDCLGSQSPGVTFSAQGIDAQTQLFYAAGPALSPKGPTDGRGAGFFFNVPPGSVDVTATPVLLGGPSGSIPVVVRAGWITEASIGPAPHL
jgi:hypothetical protein